MTKELTTLNQTKWYFTLGGTRSLLSAMDETFQGLRKLKSTIKITNSSPIVSENFQKNVLLQDNIFTKTRK